MPADLPRKVIRVVGKVFFAVRIMTWPILLTCLVLPKSHQSLPLLIEIFVIVQLFSMAAVTLIRVAWFEDLQRGRTERRNSNPTRFYLLALEGDAYGSVAMLIAFRLASLKFYWAFLFVLGLCGLAATLYGSRDFRAHPEKYVPVESARAPSIIKRIRQFSGLTGVAHIVLWLYAWRGWIF